ncbi:MAG: hypothetical protein EGR02_06285 [Clostridiales bacterium]|nr:hypothetical protein [Clostridiales bacterium]
MPFCSSISNSSSSVRASSALTRLISPVKQIFTSEYGHGRVNRSSEKKTASRRVKVCGLGQSRQGTVSRTVPSAALSRCRTICISLFPQGHFSLTMSADSPNSPTALITPEPQKGQRYATVVCFSFRTIQANPSFRQKGAPAHAACAGRRSGFPAYPMPSGGGR